jgi:hypothetical protein
VAEKLIRGRWTITLCKSAANASTAIGIRCSRTTGRAGCMKTRGKSRSSPSLTRQPSNGGPGRVGGSIPQRMRAVALAVLRAALDPDARPETPEERHHRELHDGTLNEMPPETRHA